MAVNAALLKAAKIIIMTKVFEDTLKPPGCEEDNTATDDGAAFTGAGGSLVAQQLAGLMANAVFK
jgi:hypothetical protein